MRQKILAVMVGLIFVVLSLAGCTVRTYKLTKERVDQDLTVGNRGYIQGTPAPIPETKRRPTREMQVVEVELGFPAKAKKTKTSTQTQTVPATVTAQPSGETSLENVVRSQAYTVEKGDTLQKISQKFFGTTKKWYKIYQANQHILKSPDKIYPGQVINIPAE
ncbi:MAG: LysM peptidoglycan-binding domain-containing protein [Candidatus Omnitrophica bacterium]|nr:LysM peptidoglycan-binding domain-containing protein [Candidatus Omnitrophota bacterium]